MNKGAYARLESDLNVEWRWSDRKKPANVIKNLDKCAKDFVAPRTLNWAECFRSLKPGSLFKKK